MTSKFTQLVIDCADPERLATFWRAVLGWEVKDRSEHGNEIEIADPAGALPTLLFIRVPEAKTVKNRLHIDVNAVGTDQQAEVERLVGLGARHVDVGQGEQSWVVLADPEGNEFCVLRSRLD